MSARLPVGVIGTGALGRHHARHLATLDGAELVGVADADPAAGERVAAEVGTRYFADVDELLGRARAVSVAVPTSVHHAVGRHALSRGVAVLMEKPLTATLEEAERVLAAAQANGCIVQVGHIEHFNPVMGFMEKHIDRPAYITAERLAPYTPRGTEVGVVLDLMIHDIGIVLALVKSPIRRIDSVGVHVLSKTEDIANARIEFESGCVANLSASRMSLKKNREIRIFQDDAYLSLDFMNQKGHLVKKSDIITYGLKLKVGLAKAGDASSIPVAEIPIEKDEPLKLELAHFTESVAELKQPKVGAALGKTALEVAIQITEQIKAARK